MQKLALKGKKVSEPTEEKRALPHVVPPRTPGEKAQGSEPSLVKKGSPATVAKHCFQPDMPEVQQVPGQMSRSENLQPGPVQAGRSALQAAEAHCPSCLRAGFMSRGCPA